ncbi:hypothetical protein HLH17_16345 [Acinetobacter sp. ANC 5380]|uniref:Uncharacterized protein n=1 Tax=Acinetobacter terrae TaxID=2731247 RepID=A0A7Y2WCW0_9GAMM|nr:hypothetical protein [Acinetobacter terrae]NNH79188.1 hypothetical protein [Acinetobacter terrae]
MILTDSLFIGSVNNGQILSLIMLPNTKHIKGSKNNQAEIDAKNAMNNVLAYHSIKKIATGRLSLNEDKKVQFFANSPFKSDSIDGTYFDFQNADKRYTKEKLTALKGDKELNNRQLEYLDSHLITHCWVAIHNGIAVGMVAFPVINSNKSYDPNFEKYKSLARKALQWLGYVVSCDLVLNPKNDQLEIYNIHKEYEKKDVTIPYFTRRIPTTKNLRFNHA